MTNQNHHPIRSTRKAAGNISLVCTLAIFSFIGSSAQNSHIIAESNEILRLESTGVTSYLSFYHTNSSLKGYISSGPKNLILANTVSDGNLELYSDRIGIGTSPNIGKMQVYYNSSTGDPHLYLNEAGNDFARITMRNGSGNAYWDIAGYGNGGSTPQFNFFYDDGSGMARNYLRILPTIANFEFYADLVPKEVSFDLGNNNSTEHWDDCVADDFINFSDRRLKEAIQPLQKVLPRLLKMLPVTYKYIKSFNEDNRQRIGLIAQDVVELFPSVVIDEDVDFDKNTNQRKCTKADYLSMNYIELIPIVIKGMQEQQEIIDQQKSRLEQLENRIMAMEKSQQLYSKK